MWALRPIQLSMFLQNLRKISLEFFLENHLLVLDVEIYINTVQKFSV